MNSFYTIIFSLFLTFNVFSQNTILWKVAHEDSDKMSYLLGTFHQLGNSFADSLPQIKASLLSSDMVIFESIDSRQQLIDQMNSREYTTEIEGILKKKDLQTLRELSENWSVPICKLSPTEIYFKLRQELPKYLCNTVKPTDTWDHFDNYLMSIAKANDKELVGLETTEFQLETITNDNQSNTKKEDRKRIRKLLKKISSGDPDPKFCAQVYDYKNFRKEYYFDQPCQEGVFIKGRNENWMKKLPALLKENNCMVVVGFAHLMMECGLIETLRDKGFSVEPIALKN